MKNFIKWLKSPKSDIFLFVIALVLLNLVASRAFIRLDLTAPKSYSLSKASVETVKNLEEPLSIKVFFSDNLPSPYNSVATYIQDILVEYKSKANKNFSYDFYDMSKQANEAIARNYNLSQIQIQEVKNNEIGLKQVWMGLVLTYADRIETIDGINTTDGLEYRLSSKISKMISQAATLSGLKGNVNLELYVSKELSKFNIQGFSEIEKIVSTSYTKLNKNNMGKITFNSSDPTQEEIPVLVEKYGLQALKYKDSDGNEKAAVIGLVLSKGDEFRVIPLQMVSMPFFGNAISGLQEMDTSLDEGLKSLVSKTVEIAYITGHGENELENPENPQSSANLSNLISESYTFRPVNLEEENIPSSIHTVVINGAKTPFTEEEKYKIDQFVMKGGSLMVFQSPFDELPNQNNENSFMPQNNFKPRQNGIEEIIEHYGVKIENAFVYDEKCYQAMNQQYGKLNLFYAPMVQRENLNQKNSISKNLGYVIFLENGPLNIDSALENKEIKTTVLAKSSPKAWRMEKNIILNPLFMAPPENKLEEHQENLAVLMEGKFQSFFEKEVKPEYDAEVTAKDSVSISNHLAKSVQKGKIFVVASDLVTSGQVVDAQGMSPQAIFLRNAIDYMSGNEELCKMRTKGLSLATLKDTTSATKNIAKIFNQYILVILVAIAGLFVWRARSIRRKNIQKKFNPNDERYTK